MKRVHALMVVVAGAPLVLGIIGAFAACRTPSPVDPDVTIVVSPDAHPSLIDAADQCASACDNLGALGCKDATDQARCVSTCRHIVLRRLTEFDTMCMTSAKSKWEAMACQGTVCR